MGQIFSCCYPGNSNEQRRSVGSNRDRGQVNQHFQQSNNSQVVSNRDYGQVNAHLKSQTSQVGSNRDYGQVNAHLKSQNSQVRQTSYARIKLYHYTTDKGVGGIKRERVVRSSKPDTEPQHRRYGDGVYFTSYSPYDRNPDVLALNCFTHNANIVKSAGIYRRTRHVVEIEFAKHEVQKINVPKRDLYIHKGRIDLTQYEGRYKIYRNPIHPYDHQYSSYVDRFKN